MDVRSFNFTPVSHFVKKRTTGQNFFYFSKKVSAYLNVFHQKINLKEKLFKHDEQKGLTGNAINF